MIMYQWLLEFYMTYFDATNPLPEYIDKSLHYVAFAMLILVLVFPLLVGYGIVKVISMISGRGYND